jgi:D-serine deaminase-like pyridoxal phosphate-dependent protein
MEASRPPLADVAVLGVETPLPALDLDAFAESARAVAERHAAMHLRWCPATSWGRVSAVATVLQGVGATGVSIGGIAEASGAVAGFRSVTIERPPVVGRQPERLARLCRDASITVVCDHFAQAERIAAACAEAGTSTRVLLRVDVGLQRLGVRPGPDLSDLAEGVGRLAGARLEGVWVGGPPTGMGVGRLTDRELTRLFTRCRSSVERAGREMARLSVVGLDQAEATGPTETRAPVPAEREATFVVAGVVARPTRDQVVIDAGRELLGSAPRLAGGQEGAEVTYVGDDFAVVRLSPGRQRDVSIGDVVALRPDEPVRPRSGQQVLVVRQSAWRTERAC